MLVFRHQPTTKAYGAMNGNVLHKIHYNTHTFKIENLKTNYPRVIKYVGLQQKQIQDLLVFLKPTAINTTNTIEDTLFLWCNITSLRQKRCMIKLLSFIVAVDYIRGIISASRTCGPGFESNHVQFLYKISFSLFISLFIH